MAVKKLVYPAAERNKEPILGVLKHHIRRGPNQKFLEISSGSGQHVAHFAGNFPQVTFYASEFESTLLPSIAAHASGFSNIHQPPFEIDISKDYTTWGISDITEKSLDYMYNANMMHISPYKCTEGLFRNAGKLLKKDGLLFTYGPFAMNGVITPESNVNFDKSLRAQDPDWGYRDVVKLEKLAADAHIKLIEICDMPANNKTIIWKKID